MSNEKKTAAVEVLVADVLATFSNYEEDITLYVAQAVECHREWRQRYDAIVANYDPNVNDRQHEVNKALGRYVRDMTGMRAIREVDTDACGLIGSYTQLG